MALRHYELAQFNIARMLGPLESPLMAGFVSRLPAINSVADRSPGFIWRMATVEGDATSFRAFDDPNMLVNLSVWETVEALKAFTYFGDHLEPIRERADWFERPTLPHFTLWWIPAGHRPSLEDAIERLEFRRKYGDTAVAFSFAMPFPSPDEPAAAPVEPRIALDQRFFVPAMNTPNGDSDPDTRFHYRQEGARVWATYSGGRVRFGSLVGVGDAEGRLDLRYHQVDPSGALRTGACLTTPEVLPDGRIRLIEEWHWTNGDRSSGRSVLEESSPD